MTIKIIDQRNKIHSVEDVVAYSKRACRMEMILPKSSSLSIEHSIVIEDDNVKTVCLENVTAYVINKR